MTSTTDTAEHPDVAEISDLTEGLLPPSRTADIRRHLDGVRTLRGRPDSLEEIRELLGTLPGPNTHARRYRRPYRRRAGRRGAAERDRPRRHPAETRTFHAETPVPLSDTDAGPQPARLPRATRRRQPTRRARAAPPPDRGRPQGAPVGAQGRSSCAVLVTAAVGAGSCSFRLRVAERRAPTSQAPASRQSGAAAPPSSGGQLGGQVQSPVSSARARTACTQLHPRRSSRRPRAERAHQRDLPEGAARRRRRPDCVQRASDAPTRRSRQAGDLRGHRRASGRPAATPPTTASSTAYVIDASC